jgi:carboxypeptidase T
MTNKLAPMNHLFTVLLFLTISISQLFSQDPVKYSRATVYLDGKELMELAKLGVDITHGDYRKQISFTTDYSEIEIQVLQDAGFRIEVDIEDVAAHYAMQNLFPKLPEHSHRNANCFQNRKGTYKEPFNFDLGTMGGFFKYEEILDQLDYMELLYPNLITRRQPIGEFRTYHSRPIFFVKISSNPNIDDPDKPKMLHTALHHAREPISVSQMIYFMWYLLENYHSDPTVRSLVDGAEVYFIPIVNPDGYRFNQDNFPDGGGLHRKNRRVLPNGNFGVDLNRNYDYQWGFDNIGSSNAIWSDTYRGPFAASEPEVRAVQQLCEEIPFEIALNYHSYGNALLYPFSYSRVPVPDQESFLSVGKELTRGNNYLVGRSWEVETINYATNGSSDDWMYGAESKPPVLAYTPEVGHGGHNFWPHISDIRPLCHEMLDMNIVSLSLLNNFGTLIDMSPDYIAPMQNELLFKVERTGLRGGTFQVIAESLSSNILSIDGPVELNIAPFSSVESSISYVLKPDLPIGTEVNIALHLDLGAYVISDTLTKIYMGEKNELFRDNAVDLNNWMLESFSTWDIDESVYYSPISCIADSPGRNYDPLTINSMRLKDPVDLSNAQAAYLSFRAKWAIEPGQDFLQVQGSSNGFSYDPLCGRYTKAGTIFQIPDEPVYDGFQNEWVLEVIDLKNYLGGNFFMEFTLHSDLSVEYDGFFLDDVRIISFESGSSVKEVRPFGNLQVYPNPASDKLYFDWEANVIPSNTSGEVLFYNLLGEIVSHHKFGSIQDLRSGIDTNALIPGIYTYRIGLENNQLFSGKFTIMR